MSRRLSINLLLSCYDFIFTLVDAVAELRNIEVKELCPYLGKCKTMCFEQI